MSVQAPSVRTVDRRPPRRRVRRRLLWRRTARLIAKYSAIAAIVFMLGQVVAGKVARPLMLLNEESRESRQIAAELRSLKERNRALERQLRYLQTPRGAAQAARKLGYVKPGEVLLVLPPEATAAAKKKVDTD